MKVIPFVLLLYGSLLNGLAFGQQVIPLYEGDIPNSKATVDKERETAGRFVMGVSRPTLTVYTPAGESSNHTAVLICPGGGYRLLNIDGEGAKVARRLNSLGITAIVLKYRLPDDSTMVDKSLGPLEDVQQAMLVVRTRAKEWNIDTARIGVMGFSAGGHVAACAGTLFNRAFVANPSKISLRPDFMILVYPVISLKDSLASKGIRTVLLGKEQTAYRIALFSAEENVSPDTPPTFLLHAGDDGLVSVENSIDFYLALRRNKVPAGIHVFAKGQHGFVSAPASVVWFDYCAQWLRESGCIKGSVSVDASAQRALVGTGRSQADKGIAHWFPHYDFNLDSFANPGSSFGPFARWWWPGNLVDSVELKREVDLFKENAFGGVEVQPFNLFIPGDQEVRAKMKTWDSPEYYEKLLAMMREAQKEGLTVDMTDGSGWPPGGPYVSMEDNFLTLAWSAIDTSGGRRLRLLLPQIKNNTTVPSRLVAVLAARIVEEGARAKSNSIQLDSSSVVNLIASVVRDSLDWTAPAGKWKIIAFWSKPSGEVSLTAAAANGPVVNLFDSLKVFKSLEHLFGPRTGLELYYGNPLRAVFDDSYEFAVDRHFSGDFIGYFKKHRGYDITPWLPAQIQRGYNYVSYMRPVASPDFVFSDQDWRLRYDYDLTLSELFGLHFLQGSKDWLESRGLLHRTQAYGLSMDMIAQTGLASIPETESMLGPEADLKIMTSGGHLYNKPLISAESLVFQGRAYTMTPQKIRMAVDKLFAAGVNQVVYHGVPYRYLPAELGPEGWYPFSTPLLPSVNFSANLGEGNIFWKYQKQVNEYVSRIQYALRAGKPHADVLIYFPFMDVDNTPVNPQEIMSDGWIPGVDGVLSKSKNNPDSIKVRWAAQVYPLINMLEAHGVTWDWVNDASIRDFGLTKGGAIEIRGNKYQALIIAGDPLIGLATAKKILALSRQGMKLLGIGDIPDRQPSYLNWRQNDKRTAQYMQAALRGSAAHYFKDASGAEEWIKDLTQSVRFTDTFTFTRQVEREMVDGSRIQFICNKSDQWQTISLTLDHRFKSSYWLDAATGSIYAIQGKRVSYRLAPYSSVLLYANAGGIEANDRHGGPAMGTDLTPAVMTIDRWSLSVDTAQFSACRLFDWRDDHRLKFSSATGVYSASFDWTFTNVDAPVYLDLGKVYYTAEVKVNGISVGTLLYSPYTLDISKYIKSGKNNIEVRVTPAALNSYIGMGDAGDSRYKQFKCKDDQLMAAGLVGPVVIRRGQ